ncbi:hypothetical protein [Streptomyces sp. NPDC005828]|uniref:hypothetical protein n=1 Tax=Streptomyces sp. NPDC005828 TaxID=3157071 RepID=UPI0034092B46
MFRTTRAPAAFAVLLGLVLGLLTCGAFAPSGTAPGPARFAATATATVPAVVPVPATAAVPAAVPVPVPAVVPVADTAPVVLGASVPGCDPGHPADEGAGGPVVPPRAHGFAELLPALAADRAAPGVRQPDPGDPAAPPGREPPARVPRSPVELSVLRV